MYLTPKPLREKIDQFFEQRPISEAAIKSFLHSVWAEALRYGVELIPENVLEVGVDTCGLHRKQAINQFLEKSRTALLEEADNLDWLSRDICK